MEIRAQFRQWVRPIHEQFTRRISEEVERVEGDLPPADEEDSVHFADLLFQDALRAGATDIHFDPIADGIRVRFRIDGVLFDTMALDGEKGWAFMRHIKATCGQDPVPSSRPTSTGRQIIVNGQTLDIRASNAPCVFGEKLAIRILNMQQQIQRIGRLGMDADAEAQIQDWAENVTGTFVVCGPTGSGKTTTLYTLLHELRQTNRSVITIEDPVEYRIDGVTQLQVSERQNLSFPEGLRASLRLDPDYLMLGEIRDPETARVAMSAAGTGRVLMTTLHSKDAVGVLTALRNWGIDNFQMASALRVIVAQRLVRRLCESCREVSDGPTNAERDWLSAIGKEVPETLWRPVGCEKCNGLGYSGRTGIFEVWRVGPQDADNILEQKSDQWMRRQLAEGGHRFMLDDALAKVARGITDLRQVRQLTAS